MALHTQVTINRHVTAASSRLLRPITQKKSQTGKGHGFLVFLPRIRAWLLPPAHLLLPALLLLPIHIHEKSGSFVSDGNRRFLGSTCDALPDHEQSSWLGEGLLLQSWALYELEENC